MLSFNDTETIIHAFISSLLDYCEGTGCKLINRLQIVPNTGCSLVLGLIWKFDLSLLKHFNSYLKAKGCPNQELELEQ